MYFPTSYLPRPTSCLLDFPLHFRYPEPMSVLFRVEKFEGPLDLLLQLVEQEKLDISEISLAAVAEQYVERLQANKGQIPPEELADFLVIAAKLVYLKSRLLMPSLEDAELDEGPDLATQLRQYQQFMEAAKWVNDRWNEARISYQRDRSKPMRSLEPQFSPPKDVTVDLMKQLMERVIQRLTPVVKLPQAAVRRIIRIQDKIADFARRLRSEAKLTFSDFVQKKDRQERLVSFLALLELVKQRVVNVEQEGTFEDIEIAANDLDRLADLKIEFV